tara:strand:- start:86 stop:781 length:696 start_codon:yes stop_codon:yes gene_type:complete
MCGRPVAADRAAVREIQSEQTLHLLPFYEKPREWRDSDDDYNDPHKLLPEDQRITWWNKYQAAKGFQVVGLPAELTDKGTELDELTGQPLLNYLVALTWQRSQEGDNQIDFSQPVNINAIYADMLQAIWNRPWGEGNCHPALKEFNFATFRSLLEDIALAAWHGTGRSTSLASVEQHLQEDQKSELEELAGAVSSGILRLFLGFYIQSRQVAKGEEVFEFTHKSFGEYLAA